jgi:hypothetical protein
MPRYQGKNSGEDNGDFSAEDVRHHSGGQLEKQNGGFEDRSQKGDLK